MQKINIHSQLVKKWETSQFVQVQPNKGVSEQWPKKYKFGRILVIVVAEYEKLWEDGRDKRRDGKMCLFASQWRLLYLAAASYSGPNQLLLSID